MSFSKTDCIESLQKAEKKVGHSPTITEYNNLNLSPSTHTTIVEKFGTWNKAKEEAGLTTNSKNNRVEPKPEDLDIPEDKNWEELSPYQRYYYKNREKEKQRTKERTKKLKQWFRNYKSNFNCQRCGESHQACIDFHHPEEKSKGVTELVSRNNTSKERIKREIEKCMPLCANCHRKEHSQKP